MKIAHVVYSLEMGGAEMLVAQLCRKQRESGHEVTVYAYSSLGSVGEALVGEGFPVHVLGIAPVWRTMLRYAKLFRTARPEVVHCHNPAPTLQAALGARLAGAKCVVATRHSLVAPPYDVAGERKFNVMAKVAVDWVVGVCETTCENLRGGPLADPRKIVRVYNGTGPVERPFAGIPARAGVTLLFCGRLAAIKDLGTLIRAVALAADRVPAVELWIVGDGPSRAELEALAAELGVADRVRFFGQQMAVARFFAAADVFCMSSLSEGLPMSLLQSMSLGMPAVLSDVGGMREVGRLSGGALLSPVGDAAAMAESMLRLAEDQGLREAMGERARVAYEEEFTLELMHERYLELYRGVR